MGVQTYLLDRRTARISIGGCEYMVGTLRRFWKLTELDSQRSAEKLSAERFATTRGVPPAAMVMDVTDHHNERGGPVSKTHLLLGWDEDRGSVTDMGWDYLPVLGYLVRVDGKLVLHEDRDGLLVEITMLRARQMNLVDAAGTLRRFGQPTIATCSDVRAYIAGYVEASVVFENGQTDNLLTALTNSSVPDTSWYVGKRPMDLAQYPGN